jgi:hypothetical protein
MTTNKIFAAVGDDGTRPVVWGLGDSWEAALQDCESQELAQSCSVREITAAQAAIVRSGDVSWPITGAHAAEEFAEAAQLNAIDADAQCPEHGCARWRCTSDHAS